VDKDGRRIIQVIESRGGQPRQLTSGTFSNKVPSWSRDGKSIYFASDRSGRYEIWRIPSQGGAAAQITHEGGYVAVESSDGRTLYYTKTGRDGPLFERPRAGGPEKELLANVAGRGFVVLADGIYYLDSAGSVRNDIRFHEFATGRSHTVSPIEGRLGLGLAVSPDRNTFLFARFAATGSDLMLIENFR